MSALLAKALVIGTVLGALGYAVAAGDRQTFVPPPESVAASFVRQLTARRYDRALPLLSRQAAAATDARRLEVLREELERSAGGAIAHVEGEPLEMGPALAQAAARLRGPARAETIVTFALVREQGLWKIDGWSRDATSTVSAVPIDGTCGARLAYLGDW